MLKAIINYDNYDKEITKATLEFDTDHNLVFEITGEQNEDELVTLIELKIVDKITEDVVSSKKFTKLEVSSLIKLLQNLQKETVKFI